MYGSVRIAKGSVRDPTSAAKKNDFFKFLTLVGLEGGLVLS